MTTFTATYEEYKENLIDVIADLTRYSYIAKLNIASSGFRTKSRATIGVKNTACYLVVYYLRQDGSLQQEMVVSNIVTITQAFCIKFQQLLFIILKIITDIQ